MRIAEYRDYGRAALYGGDGIKILDDLLLHGWRLPSVEATAVGRIWGIA